MKMNAVDRLISFFSPVRGLKRAQYRRAELLLRSQHYEGARKDRRTAGWRTASSETQAPLAELKTLKIRSRDLYRNNPLAFRAHNSNANNTVGIGIVPAITDTKLKEVWKEWALDVRADFDENLNFFGIQALVMRTISMHGEVLVLRIRTKDKDRVPLELKVISTKYLDNHKMNPKYAGGKVNQGIEYNSKGKKVGYWIFASDPESGIVVESEFWRKEDVIHLFIQDEPEQTRGIPLGTPSMMRLRDFDDYTDAQLMRQKVAACFSIFITKTDADLSGVEDEEFDRVDKVEPGIIQHLEPGKEVTFASPPPAEGFSEYSRSMLTSTAVGFGQTYENVTGDLSNVNYSSGRMGWIEFQRNVEAWQNHVIVPKLCATVWTWFVDAAVLLGSLPKSTPLLIEWTVPGRKMIDPVKEIRGMVEQVRAGLMSWQEAVRKLGFSPEEVLAELKQSAEMFDAAGVKPYSDPRYDAAKQRADEISESEENE